MYSAKEIPEWRWPRNHQRYSPAAGATDRHYESVPFRHILAIADRYRGIERVRERAMAFTEKARLAMAAFPDSPYQRALYALTDLITQRDH